jgi:hypothetical protein
MIGRRVLRLDRSRMWCAHDSPMQRWEYSEVLALSAIIFPV